MNASPTANLQSPGVLIIDDELTLARNLATYLRRVGWEVRTAASAEDGLAAMAQFRPAVVVCDQDLPGMSGLEAMKHIRGCDRSAKVVMLSGNGCGALATAALKAGAAYFLTKPVVLADVRQLIERMVGGA